MSITSKIIDYVRVVALPIQCLVGVGTLLLLSPGLPARYPDLGGDSRLALWLALACGVLMILWRSFSGPRNLKDPDWRSAVLGQGRRGLTIEAGVSLAFQVALPLTLLATVCGQRVYLLFAPLRGLAESAAAVLVSMAAMVILPMKMESEVGRLTLLRKAPAAFPYLLLRAGLTEETLCRGCMQTAAVAQLGTFWGIALPLALFSVGHVNQAFRLKRAGAIEKIPWLVVPLALLLKQVPATLLLGLMWHTTGNLWACILLQSSIDAFYLGPLFAESAEGPATA